MWPGSVPSPSVGLMWAEPMLAKPSPLQAQARGPAPANEMLLGVGSLLVTGIYSSLMRKYRLGRGLCFQLHHSCVWPLVLTLQDGQEVFQNGGEDEDGGAKAVVC